MATDSQSSPRRIQPSVNRLIRETAARLAERATRARIQAETERVWASQALRTEIVQKRGPRTDDRDSRAGAVDRVGDPPGHDLTRAAAHRREREPGIVLGNLLEPPGQDGELPGCAKLAEQGANLGCHPVAMGVPETREPGHEAALVGGAQPDPQGLRVRSQPMNDIAPISARPLGLGAGGAHGGGQHPQRSARWWGVKLGSGRLSSRPVHMGHEAGARDGDELDAGPVGD